MRASCLQDMKANTFLAARGWRKHQIFHVSLDYCISMNQSEAAWLGDTGTQVSVGSCCQLGLPQLLPPNISHSPLSYPTETFLHSRAEPTLNCSLSRVRPAQTLYHVTHICHPQRAPAPRLLTGGNVLKAAKPMARLS